MALTPSSLTLALNRTVTLRSGPGYSDPPAYSYTSPNYNITQVYTHECYIYLLAGGNVLQLDACVD